MLSVRHSTTSVRSARSKNSKGRSTHGDPGRPADIMAEDYQSSEYKTSSSEDDK